MEARRAAAALKGLICGCMRPVALATLPAFVPALLFAAPYEELVPDFNRKSARVTVRRIEHPTLANLDYAAYDRNPMLYDPPKRRPKSPKGAVTPEGLTFVGALKKPVTTSAAMPLRSAERELPFAWKPFVKRAWGAVKDDKLQFLGSRIASYKWADPLVFEPYQEVTTVWFHDTDTEVELWVKVEIAPWVGFVKTLSDEDGDGFREIYGKLNTDEVDPDSLAKIVAWARHDYATEVLSAERMRDWAAELASYWYPTRNTDLLDPANDGRWPDGRTPRPVFRQLGSLTVDRPLAVIEGKPFSPKEPFYNVFIIDTALFAPVPVLQDVAFESGSQVQFEVALSDNFRANNSTFASEIDRYGTYRRWSESNYPFYEGVRQWLERFPEGLMGLEGCCGWLFFRKSFDYILAGDLLRQPDRTNPLPKIVELRNYLARRDVELLFVAVPNKEEIYYDRIDSSIAQPAVPIVAPYGRKFLSDLQQSGVEVIDLLPLFLEAKSADSSSSEPLYQLHDTHWSGRGVELAAQCIAGRIKASAWYRQFDDTLSYTVAETLIVRPGDLAERLEPSRQHLYPAQSMRVRRVFNPDNTPYLGNHPSAPVLLIGDSFTGVFELTDGKSAGIGSHIAYRTRVPVDIVTNWGGGPTVRQKMMRQRRKYIERKRVVVYLMVSRDLFNYSQGWEPLRSGDFQE